MNDLPPSSVCFSRGDGINQENDDGSELTCLCTSNENLSQSNDFGIKLAADWNCYKHALDGTQTFETERREFQLRTQIIKQNEKIDILVSKLSQYEVENEALKAEKAVMVDELARKDKERQDTPRGWFSKGGNANGGSMQMLIDTNAKLMTDNARLQVIADIMRKSFRDYIKESRSKRGKDEMTIETLEREREQLQQRTSVPIRSKLSSSEITSKTSLASSFTDRWPMKTSENSPESSFADKNTDDLLPIDSSQHSKQDEMLKCSSLLSIPEQAFKFGISGDDWTVEETDNIQRKGRGARKSSMPFSYMKSESAFTKGAPHSKSEACLIYSGGTETGRRKNTARRLSKSLVEGTARVRSEELLVDFGETRRAKTNARRSRSLKL